MSQLPAVITAESDDLVREQPQEHFAIVRIFAGLFALAGLGLAVFSGLLAYAVSTTAPVYITLPLFVAFGFAAIIGISFVRALTYSRKVLTTRLAEWQEHMKAAREIAHITATQTNTVNVKGRQNVVSVNSQGQSAESVRLIGVSLARPTTFLDGVPECDVLHFAERMLIVGHSQRAWMGAELPSGRRITTFADYDKLLSPFVKAGLIADRRERSSGHLVTNDAGEIKRALGLPSGPQVETKDITPAS